MSCNPDPIPAIARKMFESGYESLCNEPIATTQLLAKGLLTESELAALSSAGKVLTHVDFPKGIGKKIRFHFEGGDFEVFTFQFGGPDYCCDLGSAPMVLPDLLRAAIFEPVWQFSMQTEGIIVMANATLLTVNSEELASDDLVTPLHLFLDQNGFSNIHAGAFRGSRRSVEAGHQHDIVSLGNLVVRILAECFRIPPSSKVFGRFGPRP